MTASRRHREHRGRTALEAVASPVRQELLFALGEEGASVREIAVRLGRSRSALHYHALVLEQAGIIERVEVRGKGRERETVYRVADPVAVRAGARPAELDLATRAGQALLRLTGRELARALQDGRSTGDANLGNPFAARGKARLTRTQLARVHALIDELLGLFADAPTERRSAHKLYAITVVLTPSRDAAAPQKPRRRRRR